MKTFRFFFALIMSVTLIAFTMTTFQSCSKDDETIKPTVLSGLMLNPESMISAKGARFDVTVSSVPDGITLTDVVWESSDSSVLSPVTTHDTPAGKGTKLTVQAAGEGSATLIATSGGFTKTCKVSIGNACFKSDMMTMAVGDTATIGVLVKPQELRDSVKDWQSSDPSVVSVNNKGLLTAVTEGESTVTARFLTTVLTCKVTVVKAVAELLELYATPNTCTVSCLLKTSGDVTEKGVCWCSEDREPTVDDNVAKAGAGSGNYEAVLTGLAEYETYRFRPYRIEDGNVVYGQTNKFTTPRESWSYNDEYGVKWYGVPVNIEPDSKIFLMAPVPCGYKAPDANGKGYPYGKLYQPGRKAGQGRGEAVWNDPSDHSKGGHFIDENGVRTELVYGQCPIDKLDDADDNTFYFNDRPFFYTPWALKPTEQERKSSWYIYDTKGETGFHCNISGGMEEPVWSSTPCPKGWYVSYTPEHHGLKYHHRSEERMVLTGSPFEKCAQGISYDLTVGGYRTPDGEIHTVPKDGGYTMQWNKYVIVDADEQYYSDFAHSRIDKSNITYVKTYNSAAGMTVRCCNYVY